MRTQGFLFRQSNTMLKKTARTTLVVLSVITLAALVLLPKVRLDYEFESFFPIGDPELEFYDNYRKTFLPDNDFVLLALENKKGIFQQDFLLKAQSLSDTLRKIEGIFDVQSPISATQLIIGPFGPVAVPYMHVDEPEKYASDSMRIYKAPQLVGTLVSKDAKTLSIAFQTQPNLSQKKSDSLTFVLDAVFADYEFDNFRVAGRIYGQRYFVQKMAEEFALFISLGIVLLIVFLAIAFRSWWGIWIPLVVVLLAFIWLIALMVATGKALDIMSVLLPTILFVVGISDVVHILSRYLEELRNGLEKKEAILIAFKHVGLATFLTSITTAIGFLTLLTANIQPVRDFGLYTSAGVFIAFILAFTLLPSVLMLVKKPRISGKRNETMFWHKQMHRAFLWQLKNRNVILIISALVLAVSLFFTYQIKVDNYLLEDLAKDDPHRQDFEFFEEHFAGVRPFDVQVWVADSNKTLLDYEVAKQLNTLENYFTQHYDLGFVASPLSFIKMANQALNGGNAAAYTFPETEEEYAQIMKLYKQVKKRGEFKYIITENQQVGRMSAKQTDIGGYRMKRLHEEMQAEVHTRIDTNLLQFKLTGMSLLIDKNNESLAQNMMFGLLIAFGIIALIMGFLFRSWRILLITLIPNMLPLLMIAGVMGALGMDLKVSTSIIFTIAFGIAVDDTIHYMSKLRMELNKGKSLLYALKRTSISTGKAITITSLILVSGFITLVLSTFASVYYVGVLVSLTLLFALLSDLFLLPVLIALFYKVKSKNYHSAS